MRHASRWLALTLVAFTLVGCSDTSTAPPRTIKAQRDDACEITCTSDPTTAGGAQYNPVTGDLYAILPLAPSIPVVTVDLTADVAAANAADDCTGTTVWVPASVPDADGYTVPAHYETTRPISCPTGPCYTALMAERDQLQKVIVYGTIEAGAIIILTPAGQAIRIIVGGALVATGNGYLGWKEYQAYQGLKQATQACRNSQSGFYRAIVYQ
jgi:hypothetical protein